MKRGFTLIELLAVIVILAIIALIATPIVLSIIEETKDNASLRSAEFYLDAVEQSILMATLNNRTITDGVYNILNTGNICIEKVEDKCEYELVIEVKGEKPNKGTISIKDGKIEDVSLNLNDKTIMEDENGELALFKPQYKIGQEVTFDPGDGERTWNVIDEGINTVTLMLTENLGEPVAWYKYENHNTHDNSYGPKDALEYLNKLTEDWNNVEPIKSYSYINNLNGTEKPNGYQKIEIKDGKTTLTHKDGTIITEVSGVTQARLLTKEEVFEIAAKTNENLKEENLRTYLARHLTDVNNLLESEGIELTLTTVDELINFVISEIIGDWIKNESRYMQTYYTVWYMVYDYEIETTYDILLPEYLYQNLDSDSNTSLPSGYWTLSSNAGSSNYAWRVLCFGRVDDVTVTYVSDYGPRPVITVLKSNVFK